ncbi:hypothetical protein M9458_003981, partial [Cirrhinus mrigala]
MAVLQTNQADLLKELDEGEEIKAEDITEFHRATDLSLRATPHHTVPVSPQCPVNRTAYPATHGASGRSGLQRAHLSASAWQRSSAGRLVTSEEVFRTARSVVPCR